MQKPNNFDNVSTGDFTPITPGGHHLVIKKSLHIFLQINQRNIVMNAASENQSVGTAVFIDHGNPFFDRLLRISDFNFLPVQKKLPRAQWIKPENSSHYLTPAGTDEPCKPQDLACMELEADISEPAPIFFYLRQVFRFENHVSDLDRRILGEHIGDLTADHPCHQFIRVVILRRSRLNPFPVSDDGNIIGDFKNLIHFVADVENRHPLVSQRENLFEQDPDLLVADRRRGLVHDDDGSIHRNSLGDFNQLMTRDGKLVHLLRGLVSG